MTAGAKRILVGFILTTFVSACSGDTGGNDDVDAPAASQLPLGSENPCWGGVYPDDLEGIGIPESDILVDTQTNDMYDAVCIEARISQYNEEWPAGMDDRLVRASEQDLADPAPSTTPRTFHFTMPRVVGAPVNQAKAALRAAVGNAEAEDQSTSLQSAYDLQVAFRVTQKETGSAEPGTVLQVGDRPQIPRSATLTIPSDIQPGERVRTVVRLVVAKRPAPSM